MTTIKTISWAAFSVTAGALAAVLAAPALHRHGDAEARLSPMWAHPYESLEAMTADADAVVLGTVLQSRPGREVSTASGEPLPFTLVDLKVDHVLRGQAPGVVTVEQTGGEANGRTVHLHEDGGPFPIGHSTLLFLKQQPGTGHYYVSHPRGRYDVQQGVLHAVVSADDPVAGRLHRLNLPDAAQAITLAGR